MLRAATNRFLEYVNNIKYEYTGPLIRWSYNIRGTFVIRFSSSLQFQMPILLLWILVGKPEGKRPLRRPRRRWVDNIKMDVREIEWGGIDWIKLTQDRDQWRALGEQSDEPSGSLKKCWELPELLHHWQLLRTGSAP
jgi:hypothetical protein